MSGILHILWVEKKNVTSSNANSIHTDLIYGEICFAAVMRRCEGNAYLSVLYKMCIKCGNLSR